MVVPSPEVVELRSVEEMNELPGTMEGGKGSPEFQEN